MSIERLVKGLRAGTQALSNGAALAAALSLFLSASAFAADAFSTDWAPSAKVAGAPHRRRRRSRGV